MKLRADRLGGAGDVRILAETNLDEVCATLERERPEVGRDRLRADALLARSSAPRPARSARCASPRRGSCGWPRRRGSPCSSSATSPRTAPSPARACSSTSSTRVLQFEGDRYRSHRILRAVKNRFGSTNELGVFEMTSAGLVGRRGPFARLRQGRRRRARIGDRVRARGDAADRARDPGARVQDGSRDAAPRRHGRRSQAALDDRRGARAARRDLRSARPTSS